MKRILGYKSFHHPLKICNGVEHYSDAVRVEHDETEPGDTLGVGDMVDGTVELVSHLFLGNQVHGVISRF